MYLSRNRKKSEANPKRKNFGSLPKGKANRHRLKPKAMTLVRLDPVSRAEPRLYVSPNGKRVTLAEVQLGLGYETD